jgi:hypothetical protein
MEYTCDSAVAFADGTVAPDRKHSLRQFVSVRRYRNLQMNHSVFLTTDHHGDWLARFAIALPVGIHDPVGV